MRNYRFSAVTTRGGKFRVSDCSELGVTSQGLSLDEAIENLKEAVRLCLKEDRSGNQRKCLTFR